MTEKRFFDCFYWTENFLNRLSNAICGQAQVPAAAVIPAQIAYTKIAAVKKLVVGAGRARQGLGRDAAVSAFALFIVWTRFPAGAVRAPRGVGAARRSLRRAARRGRTRR